MSAAPSRVTVQHASLYLHDRANPPSVPPPLTWASILAEEPFEGEHWEGLYGLPPGFVRSRETPEGNLKKGTEYNRDKESERLDWDSRWSTPSLSPLNSGDLELDDDDSFDADAPSDDSGKARGDGFPSSHLDRGRREYREAPHAYAHQREVEALKRKQYWRHDWKGDRAIKLGKNAFDIGDASTLGGWWSGLHS
jgi:gamma-tubulin complex component 5